MSEWRNWAGDQRCTPSTVLYPSTVAQIAAVVARAGDSGTGLSPSGLSPAGLSQVGLSQVGLSQTTVKAVGAGHSFTDIATTDGVQLRLERLSGLLSVDREARHATVAGGTSLHQIPTLLAPYGLAMENLGDIDRQSISGAISTGTHGTGLAFGGISTQVLVLELVDGTGTVRRCSATTNPELFSAARVGLGALGIITSVTLQCVDAFTLHALERPEPLAGVLDNLMELQSAADHFEFYWFPHTSMALTKTNTRYPLGQGPEGVKPLSPRARLLDDVLVSNTLFSALCTVTGKAPATIPRVNKVASLLTGNREFADASHRVFATPRTVKFREMEYALPLAEVADVLHELDAMIKRRRFSISFPVEVRCAAADDIPLSTAFGRESGYIAIHQHIKTDPFEYFHAAEEIFAAHGGRPHWGKWHFLQSNDFEALYPELKMFGKVRDISDPRRVFRNSYLDRVLP
ncbi:D-arabinono-1,4-lactone oxidase [Arthrobacter cryoconiti]|uniref:D-arabinono-1,4-lactone oxidase n=1 Tax=Arthrobacter cryoconiti TaxID=748907 RepID=A0ABV8QYR3_9MICC|nr:D-arabinono-1,4-lactone oxidase [Arthrobacter cryoconiti]MCC9067480.1 FAD-binding protein [Arthrobacter cryoconiti]